MNKKHGNVGNQHAAKAESDKVSGDKLFFAAPHGTKSRLIKWATSRGHKSYGSAVREAVLKMLDADGF